MNNMSKKEQKEIVIKDKSDDDIELYYDPEYKMQLRFVNCNGCSITIHQFGTPPAPPNPPGGGKG